MRISVLGGITHGVSVVRVVPFLWCRFCATSERPRRGNNLVAYSYGNFCCFFRRIMGQFTLVFTMFLHNRCSSMASPRIHPAQFLSHWTIGSFEWEPSKWWNLIAWTGFFYPPKQDQRRLKTYNSIIFHIPSYSIEIPSEPWSVSTCFHTFQGHPRPSLYTPGPSGLEVSLPPVVFGCSPHPALAWRPTSSSARDFSRERWMASRWFLIFVFHCGMIVGP